MILYWIDLDRSGAHSARGEQQSTVDRLMWWRRSGLRETSIRNRRPLIDYVVVGNSHSRCGKPTSCAVSEFAAENAEQHYMIEIRIAPIQKHNEYIVRLEHRWNTLWTRCTCIIRVKRYMYMNNGVFLSQILVRVLQVYSYYRNWNSGSPTLHLLSCVSTTMNNLLHMINRSDLADTNSPLTGRATRMVLSASFRSMFCIVERRE